jgi:hypothetical protein
MRASEYSLCHRDRAHLKVSKKQGSFFEYCRIVSDIADLGEPPPQRDRFGIGRNDDGDRDLAGTLSIRSKEGDGADRIAAKTQLALFCPATSVVASPASSKSRLSMPANDRPLSAAE